MRRLAMRRLAALALAILIVLPCARFAHGAEPLAGRVKSAIDRGCRWLSQGQNPDGGYGPYGEFRLKNTSDLGITAFVLYALARCPREYKAADGPFISNALDFLLERQQENGAFYDKKDPMLQNYKTSVALMALMRLNPRKYADPIRRSQDFVRAQQMDEADGYDPERHLGFGGFGYGSGLRPDLSNTQYALDALNASGVSANDEVFRKALVYVTRCLNTRGEVDSLLEDVGVPSSGDGGARYGPNITRGPEESLDGGQAFSSYGSMAYAALKAFLYAEVPRDDPRLVGLIDWIGNHWTVRENPGMATPLRPNGGRDGYYYYVHTLAKAMTLLGDPVIRDPRGNQHDWAQELGEHLVAVQRPEGFWENSSDRWFENIPSLNTAYAVVALTLCHEALGRRSHAPAQGPAKPAEKPGGGTRTKAAGGDGAEAKRGS